MKKEKAIVFLSSMILVVILFSCAKKMVPQINEENKKRISQDEQFKFDLAFMEGIKQQLFGNFKEALLLYNKCLKIKKKSAVVRYQLSNIYFVLGDVKNAVYNAREAVKIDQDNIWYKMQLASMYQFNEMIDSTIVVYEKLIEVRPERMEFYYNLGLLYKKNNEEKKALKILEEIENKMGINETVSMAKEQIYEESKKYKKAEKELIKLIEVLPEDVRFIGMLAELYSTRGMDQKAIKTYEKLFEIDEENGMGQFSFAEFYREKKDYNKAFLYFDKGFKNRNNELNTKIKIIISFISNENEIYEFKDDIKSLIKILLDNYEGNIQVNALNGEFNIRIKNYEAAVEELRYICSVEKKNLFFWEQLIYIENVLHNFQEMYERSNEALEYFPDKPNLYLYKGIASLQLKKNYEAISSLKEGIEYGKDNKRLITQFYTFLGEAYHNVNNHSLSDNYFEKVIKIEPGNLYVLNNYSYYLALRGENLNRAEELSKRCIKKEPDNSTYLDTYGWVLFKLNKIFEAKIYIEKAINYGGGSNGEIVEHYGDILYKIGNLEKAMIFWKKARELDNKSSNLELKILNGKLKE